MLVRELNNSFHYYSSDTIVHYIIVFQLMFYYLELSKVESSLLCIL